MNTKTLKAIALTLMLTAVSSAGLYAEDMKKMEMKEGVCMMDGKMMHMDASGKCTMMEKEMTMPNGTTVMKNGECKMKDGEKMKMKDGEMMTMDGKVMMMDKADQDSVMERAKQK